MKFKIITMLLSLCSVPIAVMFYMGNFDPMKYLDSDLKFDFDFSWLSEKVPSDISDVVTREKVQVYKWRDKEGVMQFSNEPPPNDVDVQQIELDPNSNVLEAVKAPVKEESKAKVKADVSNPHSVKGMGKVLDDAKGVEEMLQKRQEEQEKMIRNL